MHYAPFTDRKQHMINQMAAADVTNYKFIDSEALSDYGYDHTKWIEKTKWCFYRDSSPRPLRNSEISLLKKHREAISQFISSDSDYGIFLEDDLALKHNYLETLSKIPFLNNWAAIFLGDWYCRAGTIRNEAGFLLKEHPASRTTDGYILNKHSAKIISESLWKNYSLPIDYELSWIFWKNNMNIYHLENPIITQNKFGSSTK